MTLEEIISDAFDLFDEPVSSYGKYYQDNGVLIKRIINRVYRDVCRKTLCSRATTIITTQPGVREYSLPNDFIAVKKVTLNDIPLDTIYEQDAIHTGGQPVSYYLALNKFIGLEPAPDTVYNLSVVYFNGPTKDLQSGESPALVPADFHYVISEGAVAYLMKIDKTDLSSGFTKWNAIYQNSLNELREYLNNGTNADTNYNVQQVMTDDYRRPIYYR